MKRSHKGALLHDVALDPSELIEAGDVETSDDVEFELTQVEQELAKKLRLRKFVRRELVSIVRRGEHGGNPLLVHWLELYTTHLYWARRECADEEAPPDRNVTTESPERAAQAALALLWG